MHGVHSGASPVSSLSSIPRQLLEHLYLFVSLVFVVFCCCCVSDSADKRSELRRKRTKAGSREFSLAPRQPSEGSGQGSEMGRVRRTASKQPVIEASEDSEEEYDSQEDAHYENPADAEIEDEDDSADDVDEEEGEEHVLPGGRNVKNLPLSKWTKPELWARRQDFPYVPNTDAGVDPRFKNDFQHRVFSELIMTKKNKFAPHKQINVEALRDNDHTYPGVYSALGRLGLIPFVAFHHPFSEDLVMQFFATVYFHSDEARTMTWMSGTYECEASMAKFSDIIPYRFFAEEHPEYGRVRETGRDKDEIAFAYKPDKAFTTGSIKHLKPTYDTMRHILRYTLNPKTGDSHNLRSSMLDIFVYLHDKKKVDVLDFMFFEIRQCVQENKSCIYAPFIQALIESVCPARYIAKYCTSFPKRDSYWLPADPPPYVPPKKGRNPRPEDRATYTEGCSSYVRIPRSKGKQVATDASFTREEKKSLLKTVSNMFKMCQSIQRRQVKEINKGKLVRRQKKAERAAAGEEVGPGSEDIDSVATARSFPLEGWHFDDDDDASSAPPLV